MQKTLTAILLPALLSTPAIAAPKPAKAKPPVLTCKTATPEGLSYTVLKAGKGDKPAANSKVKVNYKGCTSPMAPNSTRAAAQNSASVESSPGSDRACK